MRGCRLNPPDPARFSPAPSKKAAWTGGRRAGSCLVRPDPTQSRSILLDCARSRPILRAPSGKKLVTCTIETNRRSANSTPCGPFSFLVGDFEDPLCVWGFLLFGTCLGWSSSAQWILLSLKITHWEQGLNNSKFIPALAFGPFGSYLLQWSTCREVNISKTKRKKNSFRPRVRVGLCGPTYVLQQMFGTNWHHPNRGWCLLDGSFLPFLPFFLQTDLYWWLCLACRWLRTCPRGSGMLLSSSWILLPFRPTRMTDVPWGVVRAGALALLSIGTCIALASRAWRGLAMHIRSTLERDVINSAGSEAKLERYSEGAKEANFVF